MARPIEYSLKYYPVDVNMPDDPKILKVEEWVDPDKADLVYPIAQKLLSWIYKSGYYIEWDADMVLIFCKKSFKKVDSQLVTEVVGYLLKTGFFNLELYNNHQILTSNGIQKRWTEVTRQLKRKATIKVKYRVNSDDVELIPGQTTLMEEETKGKRQAIPQSKRKESKLNNTYLKEKSGNNPPEETPQPHPLEKKEGNPPFAAAPPLDKDLENIDGNTHLALDDCMLYYFKSPTQAEKKYLLATANKILIRGLSDPDDDLLYAWARSFNRFLKRPGQHINTKTIKNWAQHFANWLPTQPLHINPDELNNFDNGNRQQQKPAKDTHGGIEKNNAAEFYSNPLDLSGFKRTSLPGEDDAASPASEQKNK